MYRSTVKYAGSIINRLYILGTNLPYSNRYANKGFEIWAAQLHRSYNICRPEQRCVQCGNYTPSAAVTDNHFAVTEKRKIPTYCCFGKFKCSSESCRSSYREGFPIIQGKSDTIHSAQGLSVGEEEFVKCLVLDSWESKWEKKWPGLFYVGASRACDKNSIYISPNLDKHSLRSIGTGQTWFDQNKVCQEIEQKASQERATDMNEGIGTEDDFKRLYAWFIANMLLKVSSWALGSRHDEEYDQRVKTKQIITDKLNAYKLEYINKFNETPTNINNVRRSGRRRRQTARYQ